MSNKITARLPYGITTETSQISTLQIPGLRKKARKIHISPKMKTVPLISLGSYVMMYVPSN